MTEYTVVYRNGEAEKHQHVSLEHLRQAHGQHVWLTDHEDASIAYVNPSYRLEAGKEYDLRVSRAALHDEEVSDEELHIAAQLVSDIVYVWDTKADTLDWYGNVDEKLGFVAGSIPRTIEGWVKLIHPVDAARLGAAVEKHRNESVMIIEEYRVRRKEGGWVWWSDRGVPVIGEDGKPSKYIGVTYDITEKKQTEIQILETNKRLEQLLRERSCEFAISSILNSAATPEELLQGAVDAIQDIWQSSEVSCVRIVHKDREYRSENFRETPWYCLCDLVVAGESAGVVEVFSLVERQPPFSEEEERLLGNISVKLGQGITLMLTRQLADITLMSIGDGVLTTDNDGRVTRMNRIAEDLCGWTEAEAIGRDSQEVFHIVNSTTGEPVESPVARILRNGQFCGLAEHTALVSKDGHRFDISDSGAPIMLGSEVVGVVLVFHDVTEQYRIQKALKSAQDERDQRQREAVRIGKSKKLSDAIIAMQSRTMSEAPFYEVFTSALNDIVDLTGSEYGFIGRTSGTDEFGVPKSIVLLAVSDIAWTPELREEVSEKYRAEQFELPNRGIYAVPTTEKRPYITNDPSNDPHLSGRMPPGHPVFESFMEVPLIEPSGRVVGVLGLGNRKGGFHSDLLAYLGPLVRNLTQIVMVHMMRKERDAAEEEQKRLMEELKEARMVAEKASNVKTTFVATMSHEIRTPLNGIIGATDLCMKASTMQEVAEYVSTINQCGNSLYALVNDVIDFAKIESGKLVLEEIPVNIRDCIENAVGTVANIAADKGIEVGYLMDSEVPPIVVSDGTRVQQVLINLVGNAVKFTSVGEVSVHACVDEDDIHFAVKDTGIGITPEQQARLFKPFAQADSTTTREFGGSGLGLAISHNIAQLMGGKLWCESVFGEGSTFHFTLPLNMSSCEDSYMADLRGNHILVVDDCKIVRDFVSVELGKRNATVYVAASVDDAMRILSDSHSVSFVFLDGLIDNADLVVDGAGEGVEVIKMLYHSSRTQQDGQFRVLHKPLCLGHLVSILQLDPRISPAKGPFLENPSENGAIALSNLIASSNPTSAPSSPRAKQSAWNILIAEDNSVNSMLAERMVRSLGHSCTVVGDGFEAVEAVKNGYFDIVLMDLHMPKMDGLEASRIITKELVFGDGKRCPIVVALSADVTAEAKQQCRDVGIVGFVTKPCKRDDLKRCFEVLESYF